MKQKRHFLCLRKDYNLVGCTDPLATNSEIRQVVSIGIYIHLKALEM